MFSFGGTRNINLRNYARSFFCWLIIAIVLTGLMFLMGGTALVQEYLRSLTASDKEAEEFQKKEKRDQTIISTAVDAILSFFEVW